MQAGDIYKTNNYGLIKILEYTNAHNVDVIFIDTGYKAKAAADKVRKGQVKDYFRRSVYGVGYVGVGRFGEGKSKIIYRAWLGMLRRCYDDTWQKSHPSYIGCSVDNKWHDLQAFGAWAEERVFDGCQLDKDIITDGNRIYSESECSFVPGYINNIILDKSVGTGSYPKGVHFHKGTSKYKAQISIDGRPKHIGLYATPEEAHFNYLLHKHDYVLSKASEYRFDDNFDERVYDSLVNYWAVKFQSAAAVVMEAMELSPTLKGLCDE